MLLLRSFLCAAACLIGALPDPPRTILLGDSITAAWPAGLCRGAINLGRPSATTRDLLTLSDVALASRPTTIVIMAGVNDIAAGIPPHETADNVRALSLLAPRAIVHNVLPVTEDYPRQGYAERIAEINAALGEAVTVPLDPRHYLRDGIHLRPSAYREWLNVLRASGVC